MYTIRGLLDERGSGPSGTSGSILASAKDWQEAKEKAQDLRSQGITVEIWDKNGNLMSEREYD